MRHTISPSLCEGEMVYRPFKFKSSCSQIHDCLIPIKADATILLTYTLSTIILNKIEYTRCKQFLRS